MVDFELLSGPPTPATPLDYLERLLVGDRRVWQAWVNKPPHGLGVCLLLVTALELVLTFRFTHELGAGPSAIRQFIATCAFLVFVQVGYATVASQAAVLLGKKGGFGLAITYLNCCLVPLLLYLPMSVLARIAGAPEGARVVLLFALLFKVSGNARHAMEAVFKFTRGQSMLMSSAFVSIMFTAFIALVYISIISKVAGVFP